MLRAGEKIPIGVVAFDLEGDLAYEGNVIDLIRFLDCDGIALFKAASVVNININRDEPSLDLSLALGDFEVCIGSSNRGNVH